MKFKKTTYSGVKEILKTKNFEAITATVSDSGVVVNKDGRKIVTAGTIVGGSSKSLFENPQEPVVVKNTQGGTTGTAGAGVDAEGVLLTDADVTDGPIPASVVIRGEIDLNKIEAPCADAKEALNSRILFLK